MPSVLTTNRPSANTPARNASPAVASNRPSDNTPARYVWIQAPPTSTMSTGPRESLIPVPTVIPPRTYADAVLVKDINEVGETTEEDIAPTAVPLLEQPLIRPGKRVKKKPTSYKATHKDTNKYQYGYNYIQTDPKKRPLPKKFEFGSIHLRTARIVNDMYVIAAANADNGDILPITIEDCDVYIMGVIVTQYSYNKGLKAFVDQGEEALVKELISLKDMDTCFPMDAEALTKE